MRPIAAAALTLAATFSAIALPAAAQQPGAAPNAAVLDAAGTAAANGAASGFLALLDAGRYADSWTQGAALMRGAVPQEQWSGVVGSMRKPLGEIKSRKLLSSTFTRSLPGAPDGDYVVVQYQTEFANKAGAVETVTPMREPDGSWKVAGYFLK
jgi:hypothetical protein